MVNQTRRGFLKRGAALVLGGAAVFTGVDSIAGEEYDKVRDPTETEIRVTRLEDLGEIIERGEPVEALYDLGKGEERKEVLVTLTDGDVKITNRITSSPLFELCKANGGTSMNITDSNRNADGYAYSLTPQGAVFEQPDHPPYELGSLAIDLGKGKQLGISPYYRAAA